MSATCGLSNSIFRLRYEVCGLRPVADENVGITKRVVQITDTNELRINVVLVADEDMITCEYKWICGFCC